MAITKDSENLYSSMRFVGDGVTKRVPLTFDLREGDGLAVDFGEGLVTSGYLIDYDVTPVVVLFSEPLPKGKTITIRRLTKIDTVKHVFQYTGNAQGGADFSAKNVDENFEQITRASQDAMDSQTLATETLEEMAGIRDSALQAEASAKESADEAKGYEQGAKAAQTEANKSALSAGASAQSASDSEKLAREWATNPVDEEVETGKYSAYHWASKAKEIVGFDPDEYRKTDDLLFKGMVQVQATDDVGTGVFLLDKDGTPRGQMTYSSGGLQFAQHGLDGVSRTYTLPDVGGELALTNSTPKMFSDSMKAILFRGDSLNMVIEELSLKGGGNILIEAGEYILDQIILCDNVYLVGENRDLSIFKQAEGANKDFIISKDFSTKDVFNIGLINLSIDGSFMKEVWNNSSNTILNSQGNGVSLRGYGLQVAINLYNVAGIGILLEKPLKGVGSYIKPVTMSRLDVIGRDFGEEGAIIRGFQDDVVDNLVIGRAGIVPRLSGSVPQCKTSSYYSGEEICGVVQDNTNIEVLFAHIYACWCGAGYKTKGNCRITDGGVIISESNSKQVEISVGTYGSGNFDLRNLALHNPHLTSGERSFEAFTNYSSQCSFKVTLRNSITSGNKVANSTGILNLAGSSWDVTYNGSTDPATNKPYEAVVFDQRGDWATVSLRAYNANSASGVVHVTGSNNRFNSSLYRCTGFGLLRSKGNYNHFIFNVKDCSKGFSTVGFSKGEYLQFVGNITSEDSFTGTVKNVGDGSSWDVSLHTPTLLHTTSFSGEIQVDSVDTVSAKTFPVKLIQGLTRNTLLSSVRTFSINDVANLTNLTPAIGTDSLGVSCKVAGSFTKCNVSFNIGLI